MRVGCGIKFGCLIAPGINFSRLTFLYMWIRIRRMPFCFWWFMGINLGDQINKHTTSSSILYQLSHLHLSKCSFQRRDYSALTKFLPPKYEYIVSVRLSPLQIKLYEKYLEMFVGNNSNPMARGTSLFSDYQALMRIWTHPWVLKMDEIRQEKKVYGQTISRIVTLWILEMFKIPLLSWTNDWCLLKLIPIFSPVC